MRVILRISGGFAGGLRQPERVVEIDALPAAEREAFDALLAQARAAAPQAGAPKRLPDALAYVVEVEDAGGTEALRGADGDMSPAFAALLAWLRRREG